jgi:subtilisin family serine protease
MTASSNELFVRFSPATPLKTQQADLAAVGASVVQTFPDGPELIRLASGGSVSSALDRLGANPGVIYAEADSTIHVESTPYYPTDPAFGQQWGLNNPNNIDIDAPEAYGVTVGSASTIVAVIDTGIDLGNPDFAGKIWTNSGNDAGSGYPNDLHGWNFVSSSNNVQDNNGHGTHVSAIIAAQGSNGYGVVGVAPGVTIMPLKFLDQNGNGSVDDAVSAIYFAVNHGARVINASWGGVGYDAALNDAIAYANAHNVVFVTAAGNDGTNNDSIPSYPASFRQPNELSVASIDRNGALASFSNFGGASVDLAAPGVDIVSDVPTSIVPSGYESLSGTSMSAAYVSGVAALVAGLNPGFTAQQIVQRIDSSVKLLPSLAGRTISGGMVDASNAVNGSGPTFWNPLPPTSGIPSLANGTATVSQLHAVILASDEYFAAHGSSATGFITGLYTSILGRAVDPLGLSYFLNVYNSGLSSRYQIALTLLTLPEGREAEVARWYQIDLHRSESLGQLEADPGVIGWANLLINGTFGEKAVQAAIMSTSEYLKAHGASPGPVVEGYFVDLLGRTASGNELTLWSNPFWQGVAPFNVLRYFQSTAEVASTLVSTWFLTDLGRTARLDQLKADSGVQSLAAELGNA